MLHRAEGIGQVGLEHDAGFEIEEIGLVEEPGEHGDGQVEVLVLLHVEVDELVRPRSSGGAEQRPQVRHHVVDRLVERPWGAGRDRGGDLDRDVVDVAPLEEALCPFESPGRFPLAEHGLAQQVHVEAHPVGADPPDGAAELGIGGVDEEVPDHGPQPPAGYRDDHPGRDPARGAGEADQAAQRRRQEAGRVGAEGTEVARRHLEVLGSDDTIDEPDREGQTLGVLQHPGQQPRRAPDTMIRRFTEPLADQRHRAVVERTGVGGLHVAHRNQ